MKVIAILSFFLSVFPLLGQHLRDDSTVVRKEYFTSFAKSTPKIDADLSDDAWKDVPTISDLQQAYPIFDVPPAQTSEIKIIYDNTAIYIAAKLFDASPDSIARQLGSRDNQLTADLFRIVFDTYNTQQDAFDFSVTASGVQIDSRFSDPNFNAVWESKTIITDFGWVAEIKIPYSAFRFPATNTHEWGLQVTRTVIRNGQFSQWALTPRGTSNPMKYWGLLKGITDIHAPIRLSLTPFVTALASHYPANIEGENNLSKRIVGGLDLKYGLNESYTLDMSLLPDFSQVQTDNLVKNLGAYEQQYAEQRPFFQENTDLFNKGELFYSRRIGREPSNYASLSSELQTGETIINNPTTAKLLNIAKISGRSSKGLGIGVLNAVLDNTYATVRDSSGQDRKILTEPFSNYNITVFDQQLKNSSNVYLINTNVSRAHNYSQSNVTGGGFVLNNKANSYAIFSDGALTNIYKKVPDSTALETLMGYSYGGGIAKTSGKFSFDLQSKAISPTFNNNAMGVTLQRNYIRSQANFNFNQFIPFRRFINAGTHFGLTHEINYTTHHFNSANLQLDGYLTYKNFQSLSLSVEANPWGQVDYYEPRTEGRIFMRTKNMYSNISFNSDSRKRFTYTISGWGGSTGLVSPSIGYNPFYGFSIAPSMRVNNKLSVKLNSSYFADNRDRGYVNTDTNGDIIFGVRYMKNISYDFTVRYLFRNNLSLSLVGRHYWVRADYVSYHNLANDGFLLDETLYAQNHDFNFNAFTVNMLFEWQFAPGSFATLSWKNAIADESAQMISQFGKNLNHTLQADQLNTLSIRIVYFFDVLYLRKKAD